MLSGFTFGVPKLIGYSVTLLRSWQAQLSNLPPHRIDRGRIHYGLSEKAGAAGVAFPISLTMVQCRESMMQHEIMLDCLICNYRICKESGSGTNRTRISEVLLQMSLEASYLHQATLLSQLGQAALTNILGKHPRIPQVKLAEENDEYLVLVMHDATDHFGFQYWFKQAVGSWGCGFRMPGDGCQPSIR